MKNKSDMHESLSILFKMDGIPNNTVVDGFNEHTLVKFRTKTEKVIVV